MELLLGKISHAIMSYDKSLIGIKSISFVEIFGFTNMNCDFVQSVIAEGRSDELANLQEPEIASKGEDLMVLKFVDQNDNNRIALLYDSDELWQDPTVINIYFGAVK